MKKKGLTAKQVEHLKPAEARYEVAAGPPAGLYAAVHPSGLKSWTFRYRFRGRTRKMTLREPYPAMTLAQARAEAEAALALLAEDVDPAADQAEEVKREEPDSVKAVAEEWLRSKAMKKTATHPEVRRILHREVLPAWGDKYITEVGRPDVLRVLDALIERGVPVLANRTLSILKRFFKWCVERGYIDASPAAVLKPPAGKEDSRERTLKPAELAEVWAAAPDLGFPFGEYFRFLILTGQRRGEVAAMQWPHVDLERALWTLPKAATKARRIHDVPLSGPAAELLQALPRFTGGEGGGTYVWTTTSGKRSISGFSKAKAALDAAILARRRKTDPQAESLDPWTVHDLRRTMTTHLADNGVPPHVLAAILNHSPGSTMGITAVYARSKWAKEKREALELWGGFVESLGKGKKKAAS